MTKKPPGRPWPKGQSGNPKGRPPIGAAIAEAARDEIERRSLVGKLGTIAAGRGGQAVKAIELLLAYAYGRPRNEVGLNLGAAPDVARLRAVVVEALEAFPEARVEVARRLVELEESETDGRVN